MPPGRSRVFSWQGVVLVAVTYVYFLIFAQFAFIQRLAAVGIGGTQLKTVMAAMASGGILFSLLTPRVKVYSSPNSRLRIGLGASAAAAFCTLLPLSFVAAASVSFLIGAAVGLLTVTLVTHLGQCRSLRRIDSDPKPTGEDPCKLSQKLSSSHHYLRSCPQHWPSMRPSLSIPMLATSPLLLPAAITLKARFTCRVDRSSSIARRLRCRVASWWRRAAGRAARRAATRRCPARCWKRLGLPRSLSLP